MTKRVVIALVVFIAAIDAAFVATGTQTISEFLYLNSKQYPIIAVIAGILVGHIWWPVKPKQETKP